MQVQANMVSHQAESNRREMNLKYWFMKIEHIYTGAMRKQTWYHIKLEALYAIHVQGNSNKSQTEHGQNFYKNNTEASRIEQIFEDKRSYIIKALQIKPDIGATHK